MSLSAEIRTFINAVASQDGRTGGASIDLTSSFANGTTAGQADGAFYAKRTIASSGSPDALDFSGGGLIDLNGNAITWVEMVGLAIAADAGNTVNIVVGDHADAMDFGCGSTGTISIAPGETKVLINTTADPGYPITASAADSLKLAIPSATNQVYRILAVGRTS